jgi:hypothetical protein
MNLVRLSHYKWLTADGRDNCVRPYPTHRPPVSARSLGFGQVLAVMGSILFVMGLLPGWGGGSSHQTEVFILLKFHHYCDTNCTPRGGRRFSYYEIRVIISSQIRSKFSGDKEILWHDASLTRRLNGITGQEQYWSWAVDHRSSNEISPGLRRYLLWKELHIRDRHLKRTKLRDRNAKGMKNTSSTGGQESMPGCVSLISNTALIQVLYCS